MKLAHCQFTIGCISTNNRNYEQYAYITMWKLGSNTYKVIVKEFDIVNGLDVYEEFNCKKKNSHIVWNNLFRKYSELEEVHHSNCY